MIRLSIIVPVFNVDKYLSKCLESLLVQELNPGEYEIIIVNDGSTDESGVIAGNFARDNNHIRLINQSNQGAGGARNTGMLNAQGKYILFIDSDDYLNPEVLKPLIDKMDEENLDVLRFNYQNVNEKYEVFQPYENPKQFVDYRDAVTDGITFLTERLGYACYVSQFIFRSDLILKSGNQFKQGIYFEDTEWIPRILLQAKKITSVDTVVFNYLLHEGSIMQSVSEEKKRKLLTDRFYIIEAMQKQMQDVKDQRWYKGMMAIDVISILEYVATNLYKEYSSVICNLKSKHVFPLYPYHLSRRQKVHLLIINISPRLYCIMKHIIQS